MSRTTRRAKVDHSSSRLSLKKQCELLNIHRSGLYYSPVGESELNLTLMKEIDEWFTKHPDYGVYRMTQRLNKDLGYQVNQKRIRRLYNLMGLQTIYRSARTTIRNKSEYTFPYLLKNLDITNPNQV